MNNQKGQSLVEILIGLGVISIMITASSYALVSVLRNSTVNEQNQSAGLIGNSLLESAAVLAEANWNGIYNLSKGSANHHFLINSPTTTPLAIVGDESVLSENIINGLVGHWKFDEISTNTTWAYDSSGQGNLGALTNSPTRTASADCKVGACLSFDGTDDYVNAGTNVSATQSAYTISMWVYASAKGGIFSRSVGGSWVDERLVLHQYGSNKLQLTHSDGSAYSTVDSNADFPLSRWVFVTVTWDGSNAKFYFDGALDVTRALTQVTNHSGVKTWIGRVEGLTPDFFKGKIDDARIYNRALSATEISQLYDSPAYSRYFYVDNVKRTLCGTGVITTDAESTCLGASGVSEDPSTQTITANTSWNLKGVSGSLENSIYMTRWVNSVSKQTDWGGSSGTAGAVSEFGTNYFDYSGISTTTSGAIKVSGI